MRAVLRQVRDVWQRPAVLVPAVLAGCFALASAADARADLAGRDHALATIVRNLGGSGQNIAVSTRWDEFAAGDGLVGATPQKLTSALDVTRDGGTAGSAGAVPPALLCGKGMLALRATSCLDGNDRRRML